MKQTKKNIKFGEEVNKCPGSELSPQNLSPTKNKHDDASTSSPTSSPINLGRSPSPIPTHFNRSSFKKEPPVFAKIEPVPIVSNFNYSSITEHLAVAVFELYFCVHTIDAFRKYLDESDQGTLSIQNYHDFFYVAFKRWIELIKQKVDLKIERCFDNEKNDVLTELTKFSSSSVEVSNCFNQVLQLWKLINWPYSLSSEILFNEVIESLSKAIIRYANLVKENNQLIINPLSSSQVLATNSATGVGNAK